MNLPLGDQPAVLRTDFSDDRAWTDVIAEVQRPTPEDFRAYVEFVSDPLAAGLSENSIRDRIPDAYGFDFLFVADGVTFSSEDHLLLVLQLGHEGQGGFRTPPAGVQVIENNLSIANMDFREFADEADANGGVLPVA